MGLEFNINIGLYLEYGQTCESCVGPIL